MEANNLNKFNKMVAFFGLLSMTACTNIFEDNDTTLDGSTPLNTMVTPGNNNIYQASQPFKIESILTDKDGFEVIDVKMVRMATDLRGSASGLDFKKYPTTNSFKLDTTLAANTFEPGTYQLRIRAVDKRANEGTQEVTVIMK